MRLRDETEVPLSLQKDSSSFMENARQNESFFLRVVVGYLVFGMLVSLFDLGNNAIARTFSGFMEEFIPSISGIAAIAPNPDAARLILSVAWGLIIPFFVLAITRVSINGLKWDALKNPYRFTIITAGTFIFGLIGFRKIVPTEKSVHIAGVIYGLIKSYTFCTSILGLIFFVLLFITAFGATVGLICIIKQLQK